MELRGITSSRVPADEISTRATSFVLQIPPHLKVVTMNGRLGTFYRILGSTATPEILKSIEKGKGQYKHFHFASDSTINKRLKELLYLGIIEHHVERRRKRREEYVLTEKGKRILRAIRTLEKAFEDDSDTLIITGSD